MAIIVTLCEEKKKEDKTIEFIYQVIVYQYILLRICRTRIGGSTSANFLTWKARFTRWNRTTWQLELVALISLSIGSLSSFFCCPSHDFLVSCVIFLSLIIQYPSLQNIILEKNMLYDKHLIDSLITFLQLSRLFLVLIDAPLFAFQSASPTKK